MSQRIIQIADLSHILNTLVSLDKGIDNVNDNVAFVSNNLETAQRDLAKLQAEFKTFVAEDRKIKEIQLAEMRLVKIRQKLEKDFGYYAVVRRHTTGILQAADAGLVRQETIACAAEELMLGAPGYWLAPALVGLAAWLRDDRDLAAGAVSEACRRDDEKSCLFFALVGRRARKPRSVQAWVDRYLGLQNPHKLDRQAVVLLDALANGVFGTESRQCCSRRLSEWVQELEVEPSFVDDQRTRWRDALLAKIPAHSHTSVYPYLSKQSPTWVALERSHNGAACFEKVEEHLLGIFNSKVAPSPTLEAAVDTILTNLITNFDDEELPLKRDERFNQLIIDLEGDREAAKARLRLESHALEEEVSFTQLLTNAAMQPELSKASLATQRLALAFSRYWIKEAFSDVVAAIRLAVPAKIALTIDDWNGQTNAGENEAELAASLQAHLENSKNTALSKCNFSINHWAALGFAGLLAVIAIVSVSDLNIGLALFFFFAALCAAGWVAIEYLRFQPTRDRIEKEYGERAEQSRGILKACLAETVEWRREQDRRDATAKPVEEFLEKLAPNEIMPKDHDTARQVLSSAPSTKL